MAAAEGAGLDPQPSQPEQDAGDGRAGVLAAIAAYGTWGFFPILFRALEAVNPFAVVAHRILWSFVLVGGILWGRGRASEVAAVLKNGAAMRGLLLSAALLSVNWLVFVWGAANERVLEISFGYFINPLVSVAIGMALLSERLNKRQAIAVGVALVAIGIQALGLSGVPFVSLTLALCFGFYGYVRKTVSVGSAVGLFLETMLMLPVAVGYLVFLVLTSGPGAMADPVTLLLLVLTGPATSGALIMFAFAARRLPLSTMGMFQYIAPSMHFGFAIFLFSEPLNATQLLSFVMIWASLALYSHDSYQRRRARIRQTNG